MKPDTPPASAAKPQRRWLIRGFVVLLVFALTVDAIPWQVLPVVGLKTFVGAGLRPVGLGTGPWCMFAPNPRVNNAWLTATLQNDPQPTVQWSSPEWRDVGVAEKFYRFRYLNYYNSLIRSGNVAGAEDFARYLRRTVPQASEKSQVVLTANGLRFVPPIDGGIPPRDEVTWMLYSDSIATIEPQP